MRQILMLSNRQELIELLLPVAKQSAERAYCRYSEFSVGAALLCHDDRIIPGCNVENASFGLTNCAERTALFTAIAEGYKPGSFKALVIYTPTQTTSSPCGACRQVINELIGHGIEIISCCDGEEPAVWTAETLLPGGFGAENLENK